MIYTRIVQFVAYINLLLCSMVLIGWVLDVEALKCVLHGAAAMKFNTAISFLLLNIAFLTIFRHELVFRRIFVVTVIGVLSIGFITLVEYIFVLDVGIDQLFFTDRHSVAQNLKYPGRMSPAASVCFVLLGSGLILQKLKAQVYQSIAQYFFHFVTLTGLLALIGYVYRIPIMYKMSTISSMAIHTSVMFIMSSVAASFINPNLGLTGLFIGKGTGNTMARRLFPAAVLILLFLGYLRIEAHRYNIVSIEFGIAIFTASFLVVILFLVVIVAAQLNAIDAKRMIVEESYLALNKYLEFKIADRTVQLNEVKERFEMATHSAEIGIWEASLEKKSIDGNEYFYKFLGLEKSEDIFGDLLYQNIHPEDKDIFNQEIIALGEKDGGGDFLYRVFFPDKSLHYIKVMRGAALNTHGRIFGACIDVTSQVKFEEETVRQFNKIKAFIKDAPAAMAMLDTDLKFLSVSNQWLKEYHSGQSFIESLTFGELLPLFEEKLKLGFSQCLGGETIRKDAESFVTPNGNECWVKYVLSPWYDSEEVVGGVIIELLDITEHRLQEIELELAKERLLLATEASGLGIYEWDLVNRKLMVDDMMCKMYDYTEMPPDVASKLILARLHPDDLPMIDEKTYARFLQGLDLRLNLAYRIIWNDGSIHHIKSVGSLTRDQNGNPSKLVGTNVDVTLQKTAEEQLYKGYQLVKTFIEGAPTAIAMFDRQLCYLTVSNQWLKDFQLLGSDIIGESIYQIFPSSSDTWVRYFNAGLNGETIKNDGEKLKRQDGVELWLKYVICPWYDANGVIGGIIVNTIDITEQRKAVEELTFTKDRLQLATEATKVGVWDLDVPTNRLVWDDQMYKLYGADRKEGQTTSEIWVKHLHPEDLDRTVTEYRMALDGLMDFDTEFRVVLPGGAIRHMKAKAIVQKDAKGAPVRMVGTNLDITQQKVQMETLRQSEERYFKMVNEVQDYAIVLLGRQGQVENWNYGAEKIFEYAAAEVVGVDLSVFFSPEDVEGGKVSALLMTALEKGRALDEGWRVKRDGSLFLGSTTITALHGMENEIIGFSMLTHDLTERKKAELSEKMEAKNRELEQITYIASHDLQEPLRTISGIVNIMNQQYMEQLDEDADKYLKFMKDASERMRNLIKGLLDYSRVGKGNELTYFDCKETVSEIMEDLAVFISESHSEIVIEGDLPYLRGYKTEFRLLLQNLISNAIKFRKKDVTPQIRISAVKEYNCWKFALKDNGIGIDPKYQEKIFMIFQRLHNRSEYEGTGIGLSHCKKIVELHGGKIWVDSSLEHGSTFYFTIPNGIN